MRQEAPLRTLAIWPDHRNAAINLGNMYKAQDRAADAVALYRRAIEVASREMPTYATTWPAS